MDCSHYPNNTTCNPCRGCLLAEVERLKAEVDDLKAKNDLLCTAIDDQQKRRCEMKQDKLCAEDEVDKLKGENEKLLSENSLMGMGAKCSTCGFRYWEHEGYIIPCPRCQIDKLRKALGGVAESFIKQTGYGDCWCWGSRLDVPDDFHEDICRAAKEALKDSPMTPKG